MKTEEDIRKRRDELRDMFWDSSDDAASEILAVQARLLGWVLEKSESEDMKRLESWIERYEAIRLELHRRAGE